MSRSSMLRDWGHVSALALAFVLGACGGTEAEPQEALGSQTAAAIGGSRFGTMCQQDFEASWCNTLPNVWDHCAWFNNRMDDNNQKVFYWNLNGAKPYLEDTWDQYGADTVDVLYMNTHGGNWGNRAVLAMYNNWVTADSNAMRLGDESYGLSILSTYACETLAHGDGRLIERWYGAMRGGVRILTGSHDKVYDSTTTNEVGEDYAGYLQDGQTIRTAWHDALTDWNVDNDATVVASGVNSSDCNYRKDNMTLGNYRSFSRLMDSSISYMCWTWWDDL